MTKQIPQKISKPHFYWLDLLRFVSALTVVVGHVRGLAFVKFSELPADQKSIATMIFFALTRLGHEAVIVFFVLSGFLVGGPNFEKMKLKIFQPASYAIDRFSRIILPLFGALLFTMVAQAIMGKPIHWLRFFGNLFSLQGVWVPPFGDNSPLWSLSYEVWFYVLIWAAGVCWMRRLIRPLPALFMVLFVAVFTRLEWIYFLCWLFGALAYRYRPKKKTFWFLILSLAVFLYGVVALQILAESQSISIKLLGPFTPSADIAKILVAAGAALLIQQLIVRAPKTQTAVQLDSLGTRWAAFSYTLYLIHFPAMQLAAFLLDLSPARQIHIGSIAQYLFVVALCVLSAYLMYLPFEKRTSEVRRWLKQLAGGSHA